MQSTAVVQNSASGIQFHILSFEGPDGYARAGGIASRITGLSEALADAGFDTHLWFVGDPDRPGHENSELLWRHRWCQWISQYHPAGVYDGEEGKRADSAASLPPFLLHEVLLPHLQPPAVFSELPPPANYFRFRVTPNLIIAIGALVKKAGDHTEGQQVELVISEESDPAEMGAYEELLFDAMRGNSVRFARQDYVEQAWRIVDPVLDDATMLYTYDPGTWGPVEANSMGEHFLRAPKDK
jgi:hypothetical protein